MKKVTALLLALITVFSLFSFGVAAEGEEKEPLRFNEDGTFKIMQIADIQDIFIFRPLTRMFIEDLLSKEKPDLVVLTGDNISPGAGFIKRLTKKSIDNFMKIFEEKKVPVAIVYGNHDAENKLTKEEQWEVYESYDCFIGERDSEELSGFGTYYLPIYASKKDKQAFTLWFFDSQEYNEDEEVGGYGCVEKDQIQWYIKTEQEIAVANKRVIPSLAFQHIIPPEIYKVLYKITETDESGAITYYEVKGKYLKDQTVVEDGITYGFPKKYADKDTALLETPCPPKYTNGQADAFIEYGNVLGVAVGHDHKNCFIIPYKGLDIIQTPTASFGSYGDHNRGARVITLNEKDLNKYETKMIFFKDYYDINADEKLMDRYIFNSDGAGYTTWERVKAAFRYFF
ncbi:MAG: metallophosphoesterase [Clostridia bacterium]|nr:metallophosphoesterase [Clostridia bacterium]